MTERRPGKRFVHLAVVWLSVGLTACQHFEPVPVDPDATAGAFDRRSLGDPGLGRFLEANRAVGASEGGLAEWDFTALTLAAFYFHPDLERARARWETALASVLTAGGRPNPVLALTPGYSANPPATVSPWFPSVSVDVPLETAGKRQRRLEIATRHADEARLALYSAAWQIRAKLRTTLGARVMHGRRVILLEERVRQWRTAVGLLEERRAAGAIGLAEVEPARLARLKAENELAEARAQRVADGVALAEALGVPVRACESIPLSPDPLRPSRETAARLLAPEARAWALTHRADIRASLASYAAAESELRLEIARQYPDVHLNPGYQFDQGEHKWSLGLSVELPVLNRNQGPIAEAQARRREAAAAFIALQAAVITEVDRAGILYDSATTQLAQARELRQASERPLAAVRAAFDAGAADQLEVTAAQIELGLADLAVLAAEERAEIALGQLEDALQVPFAGLETIERGTAESTRLEVKP